MNPVLTIDPEFEAKCPPLTEGELKKTQRAFDHVVKICGLENAGLIEWTEEYDKQA